MVICMLCGACMLYNALYLSHCVREERYKSAVGAATVICMLAAGVLLLGFGAAW